MSYTYGARNDPLLSQTYGNGDVVRFTYDALGRTKTTAYSDGRVLTYTYTGDGQVYTIQDSLTGFTYRYSYDVLGRVIASTLLDGTTVLLETRQTYNANCQLSSQVFRIGSTSYTETYTYHAQDGTLTGLKTGLGDTLTIVYDKLKRIQKLDLSGLDRNYTYRDISSTQTTTQVTKLWYGPTESSAPYAYSYSYDAVGNIATYTENGTAYTYTYDSQNQLLSASGGGKTYTYTYDTVGNILAATGTMASINPLRYRGYYYDAETGLYYLQSRYYDPQIGRFINANANSYASTGQGILGNNMFVYCNN